MTVYVMQFMRYGNAPEDHKMHDEYRTGMWL